MNLQSLSKVLTLKVWCVNEAGALCLVITLILKWILLVFMKVKSLRLAYLHVTTVLEACISPSPRDFSRCLSLTSIPIILGLL